MLVRQPSRWGRVAVLAPALIVACAAVVATAHGGYEVAVASRVPEGFVAGTYPVMTDGLALVAYAATHRLRGKSLIYAWAVVVLAAGLSGLAQAVYLASGPALDTSPWLRAGVGAWPAIAGAVAAHLVYLLARHPARVPPTPGAGGSATLITRPGAPTPLPLPAGPPAHSPAAVPAGEERETPARPVPPARAGGHPAPTGRLGELIAQRAGRRKVAQELGVTEHVARQLIDAHRGTPG